MLLKIMLLMVPAAMAGAMLPPNTPMQTYIVVGVVGSVAYGMGQLAAAIEGDERPNA